MANILKRFALYRSRRSPFLRVQPHSVKRKKNKITYISDKIFFWLRVAKLYILFEDLSSVKNRV